MFLSVRRGCLFPNDGRLKKTMGGEHVGNDLMGTKAKDNWMGILLNILGKMLIGGSINKEKLFILP